MNEPRFEVFPEMEQVSIADYGDAPGEGRVVGGAPTGQYGWRFRAANGQISATSGEGFTTEDNAERAVRQFCEDMRHFADAGGAGVGIVPEIVRVSVPNRMVEPDAA